MGYIIYVIGMTNVSLVNIVMVLRPSLFDAPALSV